MSGEPAAASIAKPSPNAPIHSSAFRTPNGAFASAASRFTLEKFFLDVLDGRLKTEAEIDEKGYSFFGVQGPWYTVGYRMAVVIEKRDGRKALVACMADPRRLLAAYDRAAAEINATAQRPLALWSGELLKKIGAQ